MSSFTNRPQYGEPLQMSSDYQAVPRSPRSPHFPEPSARGHQFNPTGPFQPVASARYNATGPFPASSHRPIPTAPGSLAPVAMASARSAVATGPQATMDAGPSRPSAKAGMSILFAGAIIGGLIGAVMHARQNAADAFAAAQQQAAPTHEVVPATSASFTAPVIMSAQGGVILPPDPVKKDTLADSKKDADKNADKPGADKKKGKRFVWTAPPKTKETIASAAEEAEPKEPTPKKAKKAAKDDDDGYTVASADGSGKSTPSEPKADKPAAEKPAKKAAEKESTKETKEAKSDEAPKKKPKSDDAVNVLKAAMGETQNTL